ncbi:hypothetical protein [Bosea sp. MMO-172]|uniref:hypothetical protein n=1 Tax=Bosea sp. MMO-172 TaxID=3127885 RepID=UPI00301879F3
MEHGSHAVILRPSLRAASTLERSHDGFATLMQRLAEFHTGTVREIILTATTDRKDAAAFLNSMSRLPISRFAEIAQAQLARLVIGFVPQPDPAAKPSQGKMVPLRELYRDMYRRATGWLHWSPDQAWNATPTEITDALSGHFDMLKAIHGAADDKPEGRQHDPEQAARNEAAGLDPEFDRAGLQVLKAKYGRKR